MSKPSLPPEVRDNIVDFLHDDTQALSQCCLVSKSWIPRTRKHLFGIVAFGSPDDIEKWKKTFPDPSNSPAHYTRGLKFRCFEVVTVADAAEGGWISTFPRVVSLALNHGLVKPLTVPFKTPFAPFYKFSPTLKTLSVATPLLSLPQVFNLIHSLPLIEDLDLNGTDAVADDNGPDGPRIIVPSLVSPKLTGYLRIFLFEGVAVTLRRLLDLPNGVHFRKIRLFWCKKVEDLRYLTELVVACSNTLENLFVAGKLEGGSTPRPIDLSTATNLTSVEFRCESYECEWVIMTIKTISSAHQNLQRVSIHIPSDLSAATTVYRETVEEWFEEVDPGARWSDLDRALVELWESQATHIKVICPRPEVKDMAKGMKDWAVYLLPELTRRGIADLIRSEKGAPAHSRRVLLETSF